MEKKKSGKKISKKPLKQWVELSFYAPEAKGVYLVGEFNDWNRKSHPMKKNKEGIWKKRIKLFPGRYEYKLIVDGEWFQHIPGTEWVTNPFGTQNCVLYVK
jgi:1,4-alpha-glucan branching enzyme